MKNSILIYFYTSHFLSLQALALYQNNPLAFGHPNREWTAIHKSSSDQDDTTGLPQQGQAQGHGCNSLIFLQQSKRYHSVFSIALKNNSCQPKMKHLWDQKAPLTRPVNTKSKIWIDFGAHKPFYKPTLLL